MKSYSHGSSKGKGYGQREVKAAATPKTFHNRNVAAIDPKKEQFEPTEQSPVRQPYKMAGGA